MPNAEAVRATGEAAVSDERHFVAQSRAHNSRCRRQHFGHTRTTLGTLVADDNDVAGLDFLAVERGHHVLLAVKHGGGTREGLALLASDLGDGPLGRNVAVQNLQVTRLLDGGLDGEDDFLAVSEAGQALEVLCDCLSCHCHLAVIHEALLNEVLHETGCTANILDVLHDILARGLHIGKEGHLVTGGLEIVDGERQAARLGHGDDVKYGVSRPTSRHNHNHGVFESLARHDVLGLEIHLQKRPHCHTGQAAFGDLLCRVRRHRARVRQRHAQSLNGSGHGVGGVHAAAGTSAGARLLHDDLALLLRHLPVRVLTVGLESRHNVELRAPNLRRAAGADGASVYHDRGAVDTRHGNDSARHVLVAAGERNVAVVPLCTHHSLDRVCNQVAGLQRKRHAVGAHGNAVRHTNGVESVAHHARVLHAHFDLGRQIHEMHVAGVALIPH
mmetsp:Transcript_5024/g.8061  ORF Transcript_5024/g.8061 Transcript_5024/m.8061 type:complete len:444 (+) Transcript_5024:422-1753(+)